GAPDHWTLTTSGGATLIDTTFANYPGNTQSFGGSDGSGGYLTVGPYSPQTGATEANTLGFTFGGVPMDAVYHLSFTFASNTSSLALNFIGGQNQGTDDEGWGLDNVNVVTDARTDVSTVPLPSAAPTGMLMIAGLGAAHMLRKRRHIA
ncbi:MAG TPA: hypothetical protein VGN88_03160, partial [Phycisphaerae bacterium]